MPLNIKMKTKCVKAEDLEDSPYTYVSGYTPHQNVTSTTIYLTTYLYYILSISSIGIVKEGHEPWAVPADVFTVPADAGCRAFASLPAADLSEPRLPPFDYTPPPYLGPSKEEVYALRKQYLSPGSLLDLC
jgi:hypothetical protein